MKNLKNLLRNKKALSPVIATVILVAVTIVVAVSVAYWMGTIASSYTAFEQIELPTSYPEWKQDLMTKQITGEVVGTGDGTTTVFYLDMIPVVSGSEVVKVDGMPKTRTTDYAIDYATGKITFTTAPAVGAQVTADYTGTLDGWKVNIELKNSGSADATINNIFLNQKPLKDYPAGSIKLFVSDDVVPSNEQPLSNIAISVKKGTNQKIVIHIREDTEGCSHGTNINFRLHSAAGQDYPTQVKLP